MPKKGQNDTSFSLVARPLAAINPPFVTADPLGTYDVGVRRDSYTVEGRPLSVNWWYPAMISADSIPFVGSGGVVGKAYPDALLDTSGGPYPLILFSPGPAAREIHIISIARISLAIATSSSALPTSTPPV